LILLLVTGCTPNVTPPSVPDSGLSKGSIVILGGMDTVQDFTPALTLQCEDAAYMRFSGNGTEWTSWFIYNTNYNDFNISEDANGMTFGSGIKTIYVQFKDSEGNLSPSDDLAYDTIVYNMPELSLLEIDPASTVMSPKEKKTFSVSGWSSSKEYEIPLIGGNVAWEPCCDAKVDPVHSLITTYTSPSNAGTFHVNVYYGGKQKTAMIYVTD